MRNRLRISALTLGAALLFLASTGCSPEIHDYCADLIACERGNEYDEDACVEALETEQDISDVYGCKTEYDTWLTCESANVMCVPVSSAASTTAPSLEESGSVDEVYGERDQMMLSSGNTCATYYSNWGRCMETADADWD